MVQTLKLRSTSPNIAQGMALAAIAALLLPVLDATGKILMLDHGLSALSVAFWRLLLPTIVVVPLIVAREGARALVAERPWLSLVRGALLGLGGLAFFASLRLMPLADATALFFVEPMIITLFAALFLREPTGWRRILAVVVGFCGAVVVIRPSFSVFGPVALMPVLSAALIAAYFLIGRSLSRATSALVLQFYSGLGGSTVLAVAAFALSPLVPPELSLAAPQTAVALVLLVLMGLVGFIGHLMNTMAYAVAPPAVVAPLGYLEIVSAVALGYLLFANFPDAVTGLGIAIIVASGAFIYLRELAISRREPMIAGDH